MGPLDSFPVYILFSFTCFLSSNLFLYTSLVADKLRSFDRSEGTKVAGDLFTEHAHPPRNVKGGRIKRANKELKRVE